MVVRFRYNLRIFTPILEFGGFKTAEKTSCGIKVMHRIRKGRVGKIQCAFSEVDFLNKIMGVSAL